MQADVILLRCENTELQATISETRKSIKMATQSQESELQLVDLTRSISEELDLTKSRRSTQETLDNNDHSDVDSESMLAGTLDSQVSARGRS